MVDPTAYKGDLPFSRRGMCLGCGELVVLARHAHVRVIGKRDGSVVVFIDAEPQTSLATDVDRVTEPGMFLLGVAHRDCTQKVRRTTKERGGNPSCLSAASDQRGGRRRGASPSTAALATKR